MLNLVRRDTSDLPPESQITNKEGKIVLGYQTKDSMHLQYGAYCPPARSHGALPAHAFRIRWLIEACR